MKNLSVIRVQMLRLYPTPVERTSAVNGVKSLRHGAVVLAGNLPKSEGQADANAIELSAKQLDNLCAGCGIPGTGRPSWTILAQYMLGGRGFANISSEEHKAGDKYVDSVSGEEKVYTKTSTNCSIDSLMPPETVLNKIQSAAVDKVLNWTDTEEELKKIFAVPQEEPVKTE